MKEFSIIIPVYKEEDAIAKTIDDILESVPKDSYEYEILVVDDGSPDKTASIAEKYDEVKVIKHPYNKGVGSARKTGLRNAKYDKVVMIDGDYTYPAEDIPKLLPHLKDYDMVVGAREKDFGNFLMLRGITKWFLKTLASYISGRKIPDLNSGLRAFDKNDAMKFMSILPAGHSWVSTITLSYFANDYTVKYVPIGYRKRIGSSTFHPIKDTGNYLKLIFKTVFYFSPLKVFFPAGLILIIWGSIRVIPKAVISGISVQPMDILLVLAGISIWSLGFTIELIVKLMSFQYIKYKK